mgnify:CR=1 FL=1
MHKKIIIGFLLVAMFSVFTGARTFAKDSIQDLKEKIDENYLYLNSHSGFLATFEEKISKAIKNKDNNLRNMAEVQAKRYLAALEEKTIHFKDINKVVNAEIDKMNGQVKNGDQNYHKSDELTDLQSRINRTIEALYKESEFIAKLIDEKNKVLDEKDIKKSYEQAVAIRVEVEEFITKMDQQYGEDFALKQDFSDIIKALANDLQSQIEAKMPDPKGDKNDTQKETHKNNIERSIVNDPELESQPMSASLLAPSTGFLVGDDKSAIIVISWIILLTVSSLFIVKRI